MRHSASDAKEDSSGDGEAKREKQEDSRPNAELIVYAPSGAVVARWPLSDEEVTIGREGYPADIQLEGHRVSRPHAKVIRTPTGHRIVDLDSRNGVKKGGVRAAAWDLALGDEVELGGYRLVYVVSGQDPDRTIPDADPESAEGRLRLDLDSRQVWFGERRLERPLSRLEFKLLSFLYVRVGRVCSREELGSAVWGEGVFEDVMVHQLVHRVREKLGDDTEHPRYLVNLPGQGYRLDL